MKTVDDLHIQLANTPSVIENLLKGLSEELIHSNEGPGTWSPFQVIGHLAEADNSNWVPRIGIFLDGQNTVLPLFDRFQHLKKYQDHTFSEVLTLFKKTRLESLKYLAGLDLTSEQLQLKKIHPDLGEISLLQLINTWYSHDLSHLAQITRTIAKQFENEIGPFKQYLSVYR